MKKLAVVLLAMVVPSFSFSATADGLVQSGRNLNPGLLATPMRATQDGSFATQETHSKYQQAVRDGNVWTCANPAGTPVTTQAGLSVTTPALVLWNPTTSTKQLVLMEDTMALNAAPAAATFFMLAVTTTTPITTTNAQLFNNQIQASVLPGKSAPPNGQCFSVSTLVGVPVAIRYTGGVTAASSITQPIFTDIVDGKIILPPGTGVTFQTSAAAAIVGSFTWEEIPNP